MNSESPFTTTGVVRGNTLVLDTAPPFPDGTRVQVTIRVLQPDEATAARPPAAPLSEEDRAILEEVYRERGCSG